MALEHRRQAAELLLFSGNQREAVAVLGKVLHAIGLRLGDGGMRDVAELLWLRLRLRVRGLGFRERPEAAYQHFFIELSVLTVLVIALTVSLVLLRRSAAVAARRVISARKGAGSGFSAPGR